MNIFDIKYILYVKNIILYDELTHVGTHEVTNHK